MSDNSELIALDLVQLDSVGQGLVPVLRYTVAVTAMASANKPFLIPLLTRHILQNMSATDTLEFAAKAREALVKMISTIGAPRVINGTAQLMDTLDKNTRDLLPQQSQRTHCDYDSARQRGMVLWRGVYSRQADKLEGKIGAWNPDLIEFIQTDLYGRLLSDCRILDAKSTELCAIAALVPIDVPSQLKSHVLGAGRLGASEAEIDAASALAELVKHI